LSPAIFEILTPGLLLTVKIVNIENIRLLKIGKATEMLLLKNY